MKMMSEAMFLGRFDVRVDANGRVNIPSAWRRAMGSPSHVYLLKDVHGRCLDLIPRARFDEYVSSGEGDSAEVAIRDQVRREARLFAIDGRGRVRVGKDLLVWADIRDTVSMVGELLYVKLWNPDALKNEEALPVNEFSCLNDVSGVSNLL